MAELANGRASDRASPQHCGQSGGREEIAINNESIFHQKSLAGTIRRSQRQRQRPDCSSTSRNSTQTGGVAPADAPSLPAWTVWVPSLSKQWAQRDVRSECTRSSRQQQDIDKKHNLNNNNDDYDNNKLATCQAPASFSVVSNFRLAVAAIAAIALARLMPVAQGVDCFKCSSRNGSNPECEDPFHNLNSTRVLAPLLPEPQPNVVYHAPCYAGKKGREGLFPASACIKLTGIFDATGETLVVRHCALDSGTLTQDTELARMSHCGKFQFEGDLLKGCVLACPEDACNSANSRIDLSSTTKAASLFLATLSSLALMTTVLRTTHNHQLTARTVSVHNWN